MKARDKKILLEEGFYQNEDMDAKAAKCTNCGCKVRGGRKWVRCSTPPGGDSDRTPWCGSCARFMVEVMRARREKRG